MDKGKNMYKGVFKINYLFVISSLLFLLIRLINIIERHKNQINPNKIVDELMIALIISILWGLVISVMHRVNLKSFSIIVLAGVIIGQIRTTIILWPQHTTGHYNMLGSAASITYIKISIITGLITEGISKMMEFKVNIALKISILITLSLLCGYIWITLCLPLLRYA